jgi:hypothetical protein
MAASVAIPAKKAEASGTKSSATQNRSVMMVMSMNGLAEANLFCASPSLKMASYGPRPETCYLPVFPVI